MNGQYEWIRFYEAAVLETEWAVRVEVAVMLEVEAAVTAER
jgi:hypothetical protein